MLVAHPSVKCYTHEHIPFAIAGYVILILWVVVVPGGLIFSLCRARSQQE